VGGSKTKALSRLTYGDQVSRGEDNFVLGTNSGFTCSNSRNEQRREGSAKANDRPKMELVFQEEPLFTTTPGCTNREATDEENQPSGSVFDSFASHRSCCVMQRGASIDDDDIFRQWK